MSSAPRHKVLRYPQPQAPQAPGDEIGRLGPETLRHSSSVFSLLGDDHLANMLRLGHIAEGIRYFPQGEGAQRQRLELACFKVGHKLAQHRLNQGRVTFTNLAQVNDE